MKSLRFASRLLALAMLAAACADRQPLAPPAPAGQTARADPVLVNGVSEVRGVTGEGALYALFVPEDWNGSLVLFAHGRVEWMLPLRLEKPDIVALRDSLNDVGYAVAYSSYSYNGWNVTDGARRTHQLVGLFNAHFPQPRRTYLIGESMGSLVALRLAETHPDEYDGVLANAGFLGGFQAFMDYLWNVRLLFDLYYPGALPDSVLANDQFLGLAQAAMVANPAGAVHIAEAMAAIGMPLAIVPRQEAGTRVRSILTALGFGNGSGGRMADRLHGRIPFDNRATDYVIPEVNAGIARIAGDPDAFNYVRQNYEPTGRLRMPLVTLDNAWDPVAPMFHKDRYQRLLAETGASDLLYRITVPAYGHPALGTFTAFMKLAAWVETGQRP